MNIQEAAEQYAKDRAYVWRLGVKSVDEPKRLSLIAAYLAGSESMLKRVEELEGALRELVFTASKLWDEVKPIKDTETMTVTHPIIENAKQLLP